MKIYNDEKIFQTLSYIQELIPNGSDSKELNCMYQQTVQQLLAEIDHQKHIIDVLKTTSSSSKKRRLRTDLKIVYSRITQLRNLL